MVDLFITDDREKYDQSSQPKRILYLDGFIKNSNFISKEELENFNDKVVGMEDEACRLMLETLDRDTSTMIYKGLKFEGNKFISKLPPVQKVHSALFTFHKHFVIKKYLFQLILDQFLLHFSLVYDSFILYLSEDYYLTQALPYTFTSISYYSAFKNVYPKYLARQVYYSFRRLLSRSKWPKKTHIAIFLYDIPNEFEILKTFMEIAQKNHNIAITMVVIDSGNAKEKKVNTLMYEGGNVKVTYLYEDKAPLFTDYNDFYACCAEVNPLYSIYRKARLCELETIQYGFINNVIQKLSPDVCLYLNIQEFGRMLSNVCHTYRIPAICVEYAFAFDTYTMEKRIKFDVRACMSEVTAMNWVKHKDPSPVRDIIGFCKIDDWKEKLTLRQQSQKGKPFDNNRKTILFLSTWAPNPNSTLLTEKTKIVEALSDICHRNNWNLLVKKHPSEFDKLVDDVFTKNNYPGQRVVEHVAMTLFDCAYFSDFICTQNSSAFIEALYLNKPFSYITVNGENLWANLSYFSKEKVVGNFGSMEEYEQYLLVNTEEVAYKKLLIEFIKLQSKFLYKIDGKASERLMQLAMSFIKNK
jgi:hypothetical protein